MNTLTQEQKESYTSIRLKFRDADSGKIDIREWWDFTSQFKEGSEEYSIIKKVVADRGNARLRLRDYTNSDFFRFKIRKFANLRIGSDMRPFEVVRVISDKTVEIRQMNHEAIRLPKEFHVGGFSAHCSDNYNQEYSYSSNLDAPVQRIRLSSRGWGKGQYYMSDKPVYFYDYNF
jgi:hypothetical protein